MTNPNQGPRTDLNPTGERPGGNPQRNEPAANSSSTSRPGGLSTNTAPPKMTDEQLRLECLKLAVQTGVPDGRVIETAKAMESFVKSGNSI